MKPGNLKEYFAALRSAAKYGVEAEFRKRFRKLRREGAVEKEAAELALRDAVRGCGKGMGVALVFKEGQS